MRKNTARSPARGRIHGVSRRIHGGGIDLCTECHPTGWRRDENDAIAQSRHRDRGGLSKRHRRTALPVSFSFLEGGRGASRLLAHLHFRGNGGQGVRPCRDLREPSDIAPKRPPVLSQALQEFHQVERTCTLTPSLRVLDSLGYRLEGGRGFRVSRFSCRARWGAGGGASR